MSKNNVFSFGTPVTLAVVPSDPAAPVSGDPVRCGFMCGLAETDMNEDTGNTTVNFGPWVASFTVKAVDGSGNAAIAVFDPLFYVDGDTPKISKKTTGYFIGYALDALDSGSTGVIRVFLQGVAAGTTALGSGTVGSSNLANGAVLAAALSATLKTGFIPLDINTVRLIGSNVIQNTTEGGVPDGNTAPILQRINSATDIALTLTWAATIVVEVQFAPTPKPPDMDDASNLTVCLLVKKDGNTDTGAVIGVKIFDGVGDTNAGGNTAAITETVATKKSVVLGAADLAAYPGVLNISLTPGTHGTDAIAVLAAWIEYTRK